MTLPADHVNASDLFAQLKKLLETSYSRGPLIEVASSWLPQHTSYNPQTFWDVQDDKERYAIHNLMVSYKDSAISLWNFWKKQTTPQDQIKHLQALDKDGVCVFRSLWSWIDPSAQKDSTARPFHNSPSSGDLKAAVSLLSAILPFTPKELLAWKDEPGSGFLSGLKSDILKIMEGSPVPGLQDLLKEIVKISGERPVNDPKKSPWKKIKTKDQAMALIEQGYRLDDEVDLGVISMPVFEYLWIKRHHGNYSKKVSFSVEDLDTSSYVSTESHALASDRLIALNKQKKDWDYLIPQDRRASVGYIKKIQDAAGQDELGNAPLMYLIRHRSDLISKALSTIPADQVVSSLNHKDRAGVPMFVKILTSYSSERFKDLVYFEPQINWKAEVGYFSYMRKNKEWFALCGSEQGPTLDALNTLSQKDPVWFFGSQAEQQRLCTRLDKVFALAASQDKREGSVFASLLPELLVFASNLDAWKSSSLSPELVTRLSFAFILTCDTKLLGSHQIRLDSIAMGSASYTTAPLLSALEALTVWTPDMVKILKKGNVLFAQPLSRTFSRDWDAKQECQRLAAQGEAYLIENAMGIDRDLSPSAPRKKM